MRIGSYLNIYTYNNSSINRYSKNPLTTNRNKTNISFKSYWDDRLDDLEDELHKTKKSIKEDKEYYDWKKQQNSDTIDNLDTQITDIQENNEVLSRQVEKLKQEEAKRNKKLAELDRQNQSLDETIEQTKKERASLDAERKKILDKIKQDRIAAELKTQEQIEQTTKVTNEKFHTEVQTILANAKTTLTERVITPTKLENQAGNVNVPGGVLIEADSTEQFKKLFEWIVRKTDSNYATIDASSFENKADLFKTIINISKKAQKKFESTGRRTFTFIDNFESCAIPKEENYAIIGPLKDFLDTTSTEFHNTLVVSTKDKSILDPIVSADHRFQVKTKVDNAFLMDDKFGYNVILKELETLVAKGKEIKDTSIDYLFKRAIKRTKEIFSSKEQPPKEVKSTSPQLLHEMEEALKQKDLQMQNELVGGGDRTEMTSKHKQQMEVLVHQLESKPPISDAELKNSLKEQLEEMQVKHNAKIEINPPPPTPKERELRAVLDAINDLSRPKGLGRIAGYEEQKDLLMKNLGTSIALEKVGKPANVPNGILLFGPKGVGKTTFSRALAEQLNCKFVSIITELDPQKDFKNLRNAAIQAQKNFEKDGIRTIIEIDEFEAFAPKDSRMTGPFKGFIENISKEYHCTVLAITQHPEEIDDVLLKDNRFAIKVGMPPASKDDIKAIIKYYTKDHVSSKINYDELAEQTTKIQSNKAFSNARIRNIVTKLFSNSRDFGKKLTQADLLAAIKKTIPDISTKTLEMFEKQVKRIKNI